MKQSLLLITILTLFTSFAANAQIYIDSVFYPKGGTKFKINYDLPASTNIQAPQVNGNSWNYAALSPNSSDSIVYVSSATTQYDTIFPNTIAKKLPFNSSYIFIKKTAKCLLNMGTASPDFNGGYSIYKAQIEDTLGYLPTIKSSVEKISYGKLYLKKKSELSAYDSLETTIYTTNLSLTNAHGTIALPSGTFSCLRTRKTFFSRLYTRSKLKNMATWVSASVVKDSGTVYTFEGRVNGAFLAEAKVDSINGSNIVDFSYRTGTITGLDQSYAASNKDIIITTDATTLNIFADPSIFMNCSYRITNNIGQSVSKGILNTANMIDISYLPLGSYYLNLSDKNGGLIANKRFIRQ